MSTPQLLAEESLNRLLPTRGFFQILDERLTLVPKGTVPGPSARLLTIYARMDDEWRELLDSHCTAVHPRPAALPGGLEPLDCDQWLTGPELTTFLGISHRPTEVAVNGDYLFISMYFGA